MQPDGLLMEVGVFASSCMFVVDSEGMGETAFGHTQFAFEFSVGFPDGGYGIGHSSKLDFVGRRCVDAVIDDEVDISRLSLQRNLTMVALVDVLIDVTLALWARQGFGLRLSWPLAA